MSSSPDGRVCPCCRQRPADPAWRPFCSKRCQLQDLANWADGSYRVAGEPAIDAADDLKSDVSSLKSDDFTS